MVMNKPTTMPRHHTHTHITRAHKYTHSCTRTHAHAHPPLTPTLTHTQTYTPSQHTLSPEGPNTPSHQGHHNSCTNPEAHGNTLVVNKVRVRVRGWL